MQFYYIFCFRILSFKRSSFILLFVIYMICILVYLMLIFGIYFWYQQRFYYFDFEVLDEVDNSKDFLVKYQMVLRILQEVIKRMLFFVKRRLFVLFFLGLVLSSFQVVMDDNFFSFFGIQLMLVCYFFFGIVFGCYDVEIFFYG